MWGSVSHYGFGRGRITPGERARYARVLSDTLCLDENLSASARPGSAMATEALEDRFEQLNVWRSGDKRTPHKPLLILLAALAVSTVAWPIPALVRLSSNIRKPVCVLVDPLEP